MLKRFFILFLFCSSFIKLFAQQEQIITFPSGNITLKGTLSLPAGTGPFPAVVIIHGSGPTDRNATFTVSQPSECLYPCLLNKTLRPYKDIAEALSKEGIIFLRYDKRTFSHAQTIDLNTFSHYTLVQDVHNALNYLKTRAEVDTNRLFLTGHSEGGTFAPMVASKRKDIRGILALSAAAQPLDSTMVDQYRYIYTVCQNPAAGNLAAAQIKATMQNIRQHNYPKDSMIMGMPVHLWNEWLGMFDSTVYYYKQIPQPVIFMQGKADFNVSYQKNVNVFAQQITRRNVHVQLYDSMNHFLTYPCSPNVPNAFTDTMISFIKNAPSTGIYTAQNPISNKINYRVTSVNIEIILSENEKLKELRIFDISGKEVQLNTPGKNENLIIIDRTRLKNGVYILKGRTNLQLFSERIVIH